MWEHIGVKKKFLIVGDNHLDSRTPESRIDNYMETGLMELRETLDIASAAKVDYYILLGDVFNRMEVGGECRNRALEILCSNNGEPWGFEKYVVVGNHDIAHNSHNLEKSALQTLISAGALKCVDKIPDLPVTFLHFKPDLDYQVQYGELCNYLDDIIFLHASIVDKPAIFDHILFSELKFRRATKLIISGHIHTPMMAYNAETDTRFINPGSLGRPDISEKHKPQVLLLQYDFENHSYLHKFLQLKNSLPHDVIFDIDRSSKIKQENKSTKLFIETITNMSVSANTTGNIENDFREFAKNKNVEKDVIKEAIETIQTIKLGGNN